jgi:hypothetical protein
MNLTHDNNTQAPFRKPPAKLRIALALISITTAVFGLAALAAPARLSRTVHSVTHQDARMEVKAAPTAKSTPNTPPPRAAASPPVTAKPPSLGSVATMPSRSAGATASTDTPTSGRPLPRVHVDFFAGADFATVVRRLDLRVLIHHQDKNGLQTYTELPAMDLNAPGVQLPMRQVTAEIRGRMTLRLDPRRDRLAPDLREWIDHLMAQLPGVREVIAVERTDRLSRAIQQAWRALPAMAPDKNAELEARFNVTGDNVTVSLIPPEAR